MPSKWPDITQRPTQLRWPAKHRTKPAHCLSSRLVLCPRLASVTAHQLTASQGMLTLRPPFGKRHTGGATRCLACSARAVACDEGVFARAELPGEASLIRIWRQILLRICPQASLYSMSATHGRISCPPCSRASGSFRSALPPKRGIPLGTAGVCVASVFLLVGFWACLVVFGVVLSLVVFVCGLSLTPAASPTPPDWPVGPLHVFLTAFARSPSSFTRAVGVCLFGFLSVGVCWFVLVVCVVWLGSRSFCILPLRSCGRHLAFPVC